MTRSGLRQLIERLGKAAKIEAARCSPHTLRHTFGKQALDAGVNLVAVARLLGHERLETTAIYTQPSHQDLLTPALRTKAGARPTAAGLRSQAGWV